MASISFAYTATTSARTPPIVREALGRKPEPATATGVPPAAGPEEGATLVTAKGGVGVGVGDHTGVLVAVGVNVGVDVGLGGIGVRVGVDVGPGGVGVSVIVGVSVGVGVRVGVGVQADPVTSTQLENDEV
jgi:hypothetical protein